MRRGQFLDRPVLPDHAVTIARAQPELKLFRVKFALQDVYEFGRFLLRELSAAVIDDHTRFVGDVLLFRKHDDVAAEGNVVVLHRHADRKCFQRRPARIILLGIISHDRQVRGVAARLHAVRNGLRESLFGLFREHVQKRRRRRLERGTAAEFLDRIVGHAVA